MELHDIKNCGCDNCELIRDNSTNLLAREINNLTFNQFYNVLLNVGLMLYRSDDTDELFETYPEELQAKVSAAAAAEFINEIRQASLEHAAKEFH